MTKTYIRVICVFILILSMFFTGAVRIAVINDDGEISAASEQNSTVVTVSGNRGRIFDCNGTPLTGNVTKNIAVITPAPQTIMYCSTAFAGEQKISILGKLRNGKPAVVETENEISCAGVVNLSVPVWQSEDGFCAHLLGYTDSSLHGVSGLEKAMDKYLYSDEKITVRYAIDATGKVLSGVEPQVEGDKLSTSGVITTIDRNVQVAVENAAKGLEKGAVVISEAGTGKIRGMLSKPSFSAANITEALSGENSPLINRALIGYNVGSAFKPCIAASSDNYNVTVECTGSIEIDGNSFACHNAAGHGTVDIGQALVKSCNSYFYRFALAQGGDRVYETATLFGFGYSKTLCEGIATQGESIPSRTTLSGSRALANFSIGQGELLASPVSMLTLYEAIACDGVYHLPTLIEGIMENATVTEAYDIQPATKALSSETANRLKGYLKEVVISGTGTNAFSEKVEVAGKTSTAQTGWSSEDGTLKKHSWFCGFFPADDPKYIAIVLVEDSANTSVTATGIFRYIAEAITQ